MNDRKVWARSRFPRRDPFDVDDWQAGSSIDRLVDLRRVFGPRPRRRTPTPPRIGVGEITSSARRDTGALELITRLRDRAQRGRVARPGGLAWYTPTGLVRYAWWRQISPGSSGKGTWGEFPELPACRPTSEKLRSERSSRRERVSPSESSHPAMPGPTSYRRRDSTESTDSTRRPRRRKSWPISLAGVGERPPDAIDRRTTTRVARAVPGGRHDRFPPPR